MFQIDKPKLESDFENNISMSSINQSKIGVSFNKVGSSGINYNNNELENKLFQGQPDKPKLESDFGDNMSMSSISKANVTLNRPATSGLNQNHPFNKV